jgi:hypothetical protein
MALQERYDIFEPGDLTSLVCVDNSDQQNMIIEQLSALDYKIHVGLYSEDVVLKLRSHPYDVIVINDNFGGAPLSVNSVIAVAITLPPAQRRRQFVALIGNDFVTNDEMISFILSVDLVVNPGDLSNLRPVLRRAVAKHKDFYQPFYDSLKSARAMA